MNNTKLQEGIDALNRIKLLMDYDMSKTLKENINEQDDEQQDSEDLKKRGEAEIDDFNKKEGYFTILTPDNKAIYVPNGTKILENITEKDWDIDSWSSTKWWKTRKETTMWLPRDFSDILKVGSVSRFQTPDNITYKAELDNKSLPRNVTWSEFYAAQAKPNDWYFKGYLGSNNQYYQPPSKPEHSTLESVTHYIENWVKNNWKEILWIIGATIAGIVTGGIADVVLGSAVAAESLITVESIGIRISTKALMSYLGEAGVWSTKAVLEIAEGENEGAVVDLIFGFLLPACHGFWASKLGFGGISEKEIQELALKVVGKTPQELELLWKLPVEKGGFTTLEKRIFKRAITIPKEKWTDAMKETFKIAGENLKSQGIDPSTWMQETLLKLGGYINRNWYKRIPVIFAHDLTVIILVESILKKFNIEDKPEELNFDTLSKILVEAQKTGKKEDAIKELKSSIESSKDIGELNQNLQKQYQEKFAPIPKNKVSDTSGAHNSAEELIKQYGE